MAASTESLVITVDTAEPAGRSYLCYSNREKTSTVVYTLSIPYGLLNKWHREGISSYVDQVNMKVLGGVVRLRNSARIEQRLKEQASKVSAKLRNARGRKHQEVMNQIYHLYVFEDESENYRKIMVQVEELKTSLEKKDDEITTLLEDMAQCIVQYEDTVDIPPPQSQITTCTSCTTPIINRGKKIQNVSPRQARRKLSQFKSFAGQALWFSESFGLVPEYIHLRKQGTGSPIKLQLTSEDQLPNQSEPVTVPSSEDYDKLLQVLYILDHFAISDESYHELSMMSNLPGMHHIKRVRTTLNTTVEIERLSGPYPGTFRSFPDILSAQLSKIISSDPEIVTSRSPIKVKISGDGARFTRSSNVILLSFSLPGLQKDVLSGSGNHTFAAIKAEEDYDTFKIGLKEVFDSINELLENPVLNINGKDYTLEIFLGSDYKFLLLMMGMNKACSTYACIWCTVDRKDRWDMNKQLEFYNEQGQKSRTLEKIKKCAGLSSSQPAKKRLGVKDSPLLNIEPDHVVVDELHLLLRVADVLLTNLVSEMVTQDMNAGHRHAISAQRQTHLKMLEEQMKECGVTFRVWQKRDSEGRPSAKYEYTSLKGGDVKKIFRKLPDMFDKLLQQEVVQTTTKIWKDFFELYELLSSWSPPSGDIIHTKAKEWINLFLSLGTQCEGFQDNRVTPYMHLLVYHIPTMIKKYSNIKQFSGQGVEKNNDEAKKNYFSSNHKDITGEILKAEGRLEVTEEKKRTKRPYNKRNFEYWQEGGIQQARKQARTVSDY